MASGTGEWVVNLTSHYMPQILAIAERTFGLSMSRILQRCRKADLVEARHAIMLVMHEKGFSYAQIAFALKLKDHTTIIHGVRVAQKKQATDMGFSVAVSALREVQP